MVLFSAPTTYAFDLGAVFDDFMGRASNWAEDGVEDELDHIFGTGSGGPVPEGSFELPSATYFGEIGRNTSLRTYIKHVVNFALSFVGLIAIVAIIYAGFLYIANFGDEGQTEKAKKIVIWAASGILIILVSFALVNTLIQEAPRGGDDRDGGGVFSKELSSAGDENDFESEPIANLGDNKAIIPNTSGSGPLEIKTTAGTDSYLRAEVSLDEAQKGITVQITGFQGAGYIVFGDGAVTPFDTVTDPSSAVQTHVYHSAGTYKLRIVAKDQNNQTIDYTKNVIISEIVPAITVSATRVGVGKSVQFDAASSRLVPSGYIESFTWECAGGNGCFPSPVQGRGFEATFGEPGTYTVTLNVHASVGTKSTQQTIQVYGEKPQAQFAFQETATDGQFRFDASASVGVDGTGRGLTYVWDFDGQTYQTSNPKAQYSFSFPGIRSVTLLVRQTVDGTTFASDSLTRQVEVDEDLLADFVISPVEPEVGEEVTFTAQLQIGSAQWSFDNGSIATGGTVKKVFTDPGVHTVKLAIGDADITKTFLVKAPIGEPVAVMDIQVGDVHYAQGTIEVSADDTLMVGVHEQYYDTEYFQYAWVLDGEVVNANSIQARVSSLDLGTHTLKLIVALKSNPNIRDEQTVTLVWKNVPPVIKTVTIQEDSAFGAAMVTVSAQASDRDGQIMKYHFDILENDTIVTSWEGKKSSTIFALDGYEGAHTYTARVTVTDDRGAQAMGISATAITLESEVENTLPDVTFAVQPSTLGTTDTNFQFLDASTDDDGDALLRVWDFGDGTRDDDNVRSVSHRYETAGTYTVILTVDDGVGTATNTVAVTVEAGEESSALNSSPTLDIAFENGNTGTTDEIFWLYALGEDADGDALNYAWYMGDIAQNPQQNVPDYTTQNVGYKYTIPGTYTITASVTDGLETVKKTVKVTVVAPGTSVPESTEPLYDPPELDDLIDLEEIVIGDDILPEVQEEVIEEIFDSLAEEVTELEESLESGELSPVEQAEVQEEIISLKQEQALVTEYKATEPRTIEREIIRTTILETRQARTVAALQQRNIPAQDVIPFTQRSKLVQQKNTLQAQLQETENPEERAKIEEEIAVLETDILTNMSEEKSYCYEQLEAAETPEEQVFWEEVIQDLDEQEELVGDYDIAGTTRTEFFLYGQVPSSAAQAMFFEWDMGNAQTRFGQNVALRYGAPGFYTATMNVSDGLTSQSDSIIIKVESSPHD